MANMVKLAADDELKGIITRSVLREELQAFQKNILMELSQHMQSLSVVSMKTPEKEAGRRPPGELSPPSAAAALRLLRVVTLFEDLSHLLESMIQSLKALVWVIAVVLLVTYAIGVLLTDVVAEFRKLQRDVIQHDEINIVLDKYYGSVLTTMLFLYEIMSSGTSWADGMSPVVNQISPWMTIVFILYTAFVFFAMMNVVTSYFVDNTIRYVEESRGSTMAMALWNCFTTEDNSPQLITSQVFYDHLDSVEMEKYLSSLDISPEMCQESHFFELLDTDGSGGLDVSELIHGCLRLRGSAKQIDLHLLGQYLRNELGKLEFNIKSLEDAVLTRGAPEHTTQSTQRTAIERALSPRSELSNRSTVSRSFEI